MKTRITAAIFLGIFLVGCQSPSQIIAGKEDLLSAAGFVPLPATSTAQQASLKTLPPNKFVQQSQGGQVVYLYADPVVCQCVYSGNQAAYSKYSQMVFQKNLANEQQMTATMKDDAFDFSPWGGVWGFDNVY